MKQQSFLPKIRLAHGGDLLKGRRKEARPFSHKHAIHLVLRSHRARGPWSLLSKRNGTWLERELRRCAGKYGIRVFRSVNVGNHLHLLIKTETRQYEVAKAQFHRFLKEFAGSIAFRVTGARKGESKGSFWEKRVYSRIVNWGKEYERLKEYFTKNFYESKGLWTGQWDVEFGGGTAADFAAGLGPPA